MIEDVLYHINMDEKYKSFMMFKKSRTFEELFKDREFDIVQVHRFIPMKNRDNDVIDFLHFKGAFTWNSVYMNYVNNEASPTKWKIYGYRESGAGTSERILDILIIEEI